MTTDEDKLDAIARSLTATVNGYAAFSAPQSLHWTQALKLACDEIEDRRREVAVLKAQVRGLRQDLDCTYGDTPGLIHCPPTRPCAVHQQARIRDDAYAVCQRLAEWWHAHGIDGTRELDDIAWAARAVVSHTPASAADARDELLEAIGRLAHAVGYAWPDADDATASAIVSDMIRHADTIAQAIAAARKDKDT